MRPSSSRAVRRLSVALACLAVLLPTPAHATTEPDDGPTQGIYLRLDATPGDLLLSPGQSARWAVRVSLEEVPTPAEVGLSVVVDGPLTQVPDGLTMALDWCPTPSPLSCEDATVVAAPTSVDRLSDVPLEVDDAAAGMLVVTASLPPDAAASTQGLRARVSVHAHARGDIPTGQLPNRTIAPDDPTTDGDAPATPAPGVGEGGPSHPEPVSSGNRLPTSGAPLLGPALLALGSVLTGAGLAGARRLRLRHREVVSRP